MPAYLPKALLHRIPEQLSSIPRINRVVEVPVFGPEGDLTGDLPGVLGIPGYDLRSRTYFQPAPGLGLNALDIGSWADDDKQQRAEVEDALALIEELLVDFPFADASSKAHAIAMMLEPFVREVIGDSPTPLYGVLAHTPGTGKGLLRRSVSASPAARFPRWRSRAAKASRRRSLANG